MKVELPDAQAVTPGQGQTVRVAGVEVGQIGKVELKDGKAVVNLEIEPKYKHLIKRDATALLRSKTGVKDMFIEVDPGDGEPLEENESITVDNTAPDIDPDEFLSALDADTRDYLRLLVSGAGKGLKGRGGDLQETFARFGPLHRDLAKVHAARSRGAATTCAGWSTTTASSSASSATRTRTSRASCGPRTRCFDAFASQNTNISSAVAQLPGTLRQTDRTLVKLDPFARELGPTFDALRPVVRQIPAANAASLPLRARGRADHPQADQALHPDRHAVLPRPGPRRGRELANAGPDLSSTFLGLNRLFNIGAYNPGGAQGLTGNLATDRARDEGYLYWLAWTAQNTVSLFSAGDAQGNFRRIYLGGLSCSIARRLRSRAPSRDWAPLPPALQPIIGGIITDLGDAGVCAAH